MIKKYATKPKIVEAFKWIGHNEEDWKLIEAFVQITDERKANVGLDDALEIRTDDLWVSAEIGDYVIKDIYGNITSRNTKEFEQRYSPLENGEVK